MSRPAIILTALRKGIKNDIYIFSACGFCLFRRSGVYRFNSVSVELKKIVQQGLSKIYTSLKKYYSLGKDKAGKKAVCYKNRTMRYKFAPVRFEDLSEFLLVLPLQIC